jgi:hypothetical protein
MIDSSQWHNTGQNGKAREVWIRTVGSWSAEIKVMPYRCLVTMHYQGTVDADHEGIPFPTLDGAKHWADSFIARKQEAGRP